MSRFKRAILGFLVIANLGVFTAFGLWVAVDGGLPVLSTANAADAMGAATNAPSPTIELAPPTLSPLPEPAGSPTPGWTPPPILAPLTTAPPPVEAPLLEPSPMPTEAVPTAAADAPSEVPVEALALPASARVMGVVGHGQRLPLSCESRSAADWAAFFGVEIDEMAFLHALPLSDDPDRGFVGDVNGEWGNLPPQAYGVHAAPVARLLREYGVPAESRRYLEWDDLRTEIATGRPVIVWVTGHVEAGEGILYTAGDGRRTIVARFEHTVIVVGYDEDSVLVVDGANTYRRSLDRFLASWGALRNMAITAAP
jgi:uncharacterized protein YvpB